MTSSTPSACCSPAASTAPCCSRSSGAITIGRAPDPRARGLAWEDAERAGDRSAAGTRRRSPGASRRSRRSTVDMRDVYPATHWAVVGQPPAYDTPDEDVYLEGRNIVLIVEGRGAVRAPRASRGSRSARSPATRFRTRRRSSSRRWRARSRSAWRAPSTIATPLAHLHKEDVDPARRRARRAARADAVVHESRCERRATAGSAASAASGATRSDRRRVDDPDGVQRVTAPAEARRAQ